MIFFSRFLFQSISIGLTALISFPHAKDYSEEFRDIVCQKASKRTAAAVTENGITLVNQHKFNEELPVINPPIHFNFDQMLLPTSFGIQILFTFDKLTFFRIAMID